MATETKKETKTMVTKTSKAGIVDQLKSDSGKKVTKKEEKKTAKKTLTKGASFSIIETGGKQYKVSSGDTIIIEKLSGDHKEGDKIIFDKVLLTDDGKETKVGTPYLRGEKVEAIFDEEGRGKKISVIHFKSKVRYRKKYGHRQPFAKVTIV